MTAYAANETELSYLTLYCELRSVNHRYCDISIKIPERLRFMEADLRAMIAEKISRGKVECTINYKKQSKDGQVLTVNMDAVQALLNATTQIEQLMPAALSFSALDILAFPGIQQEPDTDKDEIQQAVRLLLTKTLGHFVEVRAREGAQLRAVIDDRCQKVQELIVLAQKRIPEVLMALRNKLKDKIAELVAQPDFDRLEQELVLLTQKLDVAEELDRLQAHSNEVIRVLKQSEPVGRRLDFLMQELNREANTLGSKSADKEMTQIAIELKVLIEQMREQIQNIE